MITQENVDACIKAILKQIPIEEAAGFTVVHMPVIRSLEAPDAPLREDACAACGLTNIEELGLTAEFATDTTTMHSYYSPVPYCKPCHGDDKERELIRNLIVETGKTKLGIAPSHLD